MTNEEVDRIADRLYDKLLTAYLGITFESNGRRTEWKFPDGRRIVYDSEAQEQTVFKPDGCTVDFVRKVRWQ